MGDEGESEASEGTCDGALLDSVFDILMAWKKDRGSRLEWEEYEAICREQGISAAEAHEAIEEWEQVGVVAFVRERIHILADEFGSSAGF